MIRARAHNTYVAPPGCAIATSATDYRISAPLVSTQAYMIRAIIQTPGGTTCTIRLHEIPQITPTQLVVRVDCGWNGLTLGEHPATSAITGTTHIPWDVIPGANAFTFELVGSTWVADSFFMEGHCYVPGTIFDASAELDGLLQWCRQSGGATNVQLPAGLMYVRDAMLSVPDGCTLKGYGMRATGFFWADVVFRNPLVTPNVIRSGRPAVEGRFANVIGMALEDFCCYANRSKQPLNAGYHAFKLGFDDAESSFIPLTCSIRRVGIFGSAGYAIGLGNESYKEHITYDQVIIAGADGDGWDHKDREDGNNDIRFIHCQVFHWALGDMGTNLAPLSQFPANPITISIPSGDPSTYDFMLPRRASGTYTGLHGADVGWRVTIAGATPINGIDFNGTFQVVGITDSGDEFVLRHTVALDATTEAATPGGGSAVTGFSPLVSFKDVAYDLRSRNSVLDNCYAEGWLYKRNGFRQRPGYRPNESAVGGSSATMTACTLRDTSPAWLAPYGQAGAAFSLGAGEVTVVAPTVFFSGVGGIGIHAASTSRNVKVVSPRIYKGARGVMIAGKTVSVTDAEITDPSEYAIYINGVTLERLQALPADPFTPIAIGSPTVRVNHPDHGMSTGDVVYYTGYINSTTNGLRIDPPSFIGDGYAITIEDEDHYWVEFLQIDPAGALNTTAFGGENCDARPSPDYDNNAEGVVISDGKFVHTDTSNTAVAVAIGYSDTASDLGQADDIVVVDSHNRGFNTAQINLGTNVQWGPGNSGGLPNVPRTSPNESAPCWEFLQEVVLDELSSAITVRDLDYPEIRIELTDAKHDTGSSVRLALSTDNGKTFRDVAGDSQRPGDGNGTGDIIIVPNSPIDCTVAGCIDIVNFNNLRRTWCEIDCGQTLDATGTPAAGGVIPSLGCQMGPRASLYVSWGGNPDIPGTHEVTSITIGGVEVLGAPVSYVTIAVTAATWNAGTKTFTFDFATAHGIASIGEWFNVQGMTPGTYDGPLITLSIPSATRVTAGYIGGVVPNPAPPATATGMGVLSDPNGTAQALVAQINTYMGSLPAAEQLYVASYAATGSNAGEVLIREEPLLAETLYGSTSNLPIEITTDGDFQFLSTSATQMGTIAFNAFQLVVTGNFEVGTTVRVYQKGG